MTKDTYLALVVVAALLTAIIGGGLYETHVRDRCMAAGYTESYITMRLNAYCINHSDVVVPLAEVR